MLNELRHGLVYKLDSQSGPVHAPLFTISVEVSIISKFIADLNIWKNSKNIIKHNMIDGRYIYREQKIKYFV